jgi:hypothetical protein
LVTIFQRAAKERPDLQLSLSYWMGEALLQKARNNLFCDAYDNGVDDIVFLDVDQAFDAQAFFDVIDHPVDVVGITARMKTDDERFTHRPEDPKQHRWNQELKLLEVEYLATGFLRLSRKAMKALYDVSTPYNDGKVGPKSNRVRPAAANLDNLIQSLRHRALAVVVAAPGADRSRREQRDGESALISCVIPAASSDLSRRRKIRRHITLAVAVRAPRDDGSCGRDCQGMEIAKTEGTPFRQRRQRRLAGVVQAPSNVWVSGRGDTCKHYREGGGNDNS